VPVVWHIHDFVGARPVVARALRWSSRRAAGAIAISEAVAQDARHTLPNVPVDVVYNAIDTDRFAPGPGEGATLDALAGLPLAAPGTVRVGLVATYARWKGHELFLEAAARFTARNACPWPVRFYIVGGPVYRTHGSQFTEAELRACSARHGLAGRVGFIGFQRDVAGVYRALDVVVHASTQPEPFGLTIVEAMACGRAVIVAQAGGAAELFRDGCDALGVPPGNAAALTEAIAALAADPERRSRLGERARRRAVAQFARARLGHEIAAVYDQYLPPATRSNPSANRTVQLA
jgi:glycosyltransferase involved in cell wall biosynthesis